METGLDGEELSKIEKIGFLLYIWSFLITNPLFSTPFHPLHTPIYVEAKSTNTETKALFAITFSRPIMTPSSSKIAIRSQVATRTVELGRKRDIISSERNKKRRLMMP